MNILSEMTADKTQLQELNYGQSALIDLSIGHDVTCPARIIRVSYVGELGYELHISNSEPNLTDVFDYFMNRHVD